MGNDTLDKQVKDIYANFGLAIHHAQCLEHALVNALVFIDLIPNQRNLMKSPEEWAARVDSFMDSKFEFTLGKMIRALTAITVVEPQLHQQLAHALTRRNWLVHHYFRERAETFLTAPGRAAMLVELARSQEIFCAADDALDAVVRPAREKVGLTNEVLAETYDKLRVEVGE